MARFRLRMTSNTRHLQSAAPNDVAASNSAPRRRVWLTHYIYRLAAPAPAPSPGSHRGRQAHGAAASPALVVREARRPAVRRGDAAHDCQPQAVLGQVGPRPPAEGRQRVGPEAPAVVAHHEHKPPSDPGAQQPVSDAQGDAHAAAKICQNYFICDILLP